MSKVQNIPKVKLCTSQKPGFGCAIGLVDVEGKPPKELDAFFFNKYKIHTTPIEWENLKGGYPWPAPPKLTSPRQ